MYVHCHRLRNSVSLNVGSSTVAARQLLGCRIASQTSVRSWLTSFCEQAMWRVDAGSPHSASNLHHVHVMKA